MPPVVQHLNTIDEDMLYSHRILLRRFERGPLGNGLGVEQHEIGIVPLANAPTLVEAKICRWQSGHPVNRLFPRYQLFVAHIRAEHASKISKRSRVGAVPDELCIRRKGRRV